LTNASLFCKIDNRRIPGKKGRRKEIKDLQEADTINATIDIWSDRKMRGFMATTVHCVKRGDYELKSDLLGIERFKGSQTG
jgi:hypothetical protein